VLSQLLRNKEALQHGMMASFYCQELIRNTHHLCKGYINKLQQERINNGGKKRLTTNDILRELSSHEDNSLKKGSLSKEDNELNESSKEKTNSNGEEVQQIGKA
jgi:hypothetical protein